ncbi:MAG: tetratricopeptide repeat protein [Pseudomonadota bacterium]
MRCTLLSGIIAAALTLTSTAAEANRTLLGDGLGKACFDAVNLGGTSRADLKLCTDAIESGSLTGADLPATYVNRGIILMRMQRYKDALDDYERALGYRPDLAEAKINMGAALIGLRRFNSAIEYLRDGLEGEPVAPHVAYYNLGIAHEMMGDYISAREHYASAAEAAPEWPLAIRKLESLPLPKDDGGAGGENASR